MIAFALLRGLHVQRGISAVHLCQRSGTKEIAFHMRPFEVGCSKQSGTWIIDGAALSLMLKCLPCIPGPRDLEASVSSSL